MKILLINPNRYQKPPVPPLALEYLAGALEESSHEYRILDLCFEDNPEVALDREIASFDPHIAGITIRNIDTVLYHNNEFFLNEIRSFVEHIKRRGIPVILGGVGYSFAPGGILRYLGAQWGVYGPGERVLTRILDTMEQTPPPAGAMFNGWETGDSIGYGHKRATIAEYERYTSERGLIGFETQKGCYESCSYCPEGNRYVIFKNPGCVADELREIVRLGFTEFHLCDTEFNQDLAHCKAFLQTIVTRGPEITWTLYMKVSPYDDELFDLLKKSGAYLITLSVPTGKNSLDHARAIGRLAKKYGIRLAVDFLCGFPGDTVESVKQSLEILRGIEPATVGINAHLRLYPELALTRHIMSSPVYIGRLLGAPLKDNQDMIKPVFYNHISIETLRELVGDDPLFTIEGFEQTSNYERIRKSSVP